MQPVRRPGAARWAPLRSDLAPHAVPRDSRYMAKRDDFTQDTIRKLGERVTLLCSNPSCSAPTKGPHTDRSKTISLGKACHIHAAAPGGPRYDASQLKEERGSIDNGIWLCSNCGTLVDTDVSATPRPYCGRGGRKRSLRLSIASENQLEPAGKPSWSRWRTGSEGCWRRFPASASPPTPTPTTSRSASSRSRRSSGWRSRPDRSWACLRNC